MIDINNKGWESLQEADVKKAILDVEESFFFEFKDKRVDSKKIAAEISALANTYGGYIFIGVADNKEIEGCDGWDEQRVHATIHDSLSPIPSFDVKKFVLDDGKTVLVIKVDKGLEPPYITSRGMIYERVSSGSFPIKESSKLTQMFYQRENELKRVENKISITSYTSNNIANLFGYIDVGFQFYSSNVTKMKDAFFSFDVIDYVRRTNVNNENLTLGRIGNAIVFASDIKPVNKNTWLPANANHFLEIMYDGSAKYRTLLCGDKENSNNVNLYINEYLSMQFKNLYCAIFKDVIEKQFLGAKKYEKLTTLLQFVPYFNYPEVLVERMPELREGFEKIHSIIMEQRKKGEITKVVSDYRIPSSGLYTIDSKWFSENSLPMSAEGIADELFSSVYNLLEYISEFFEINKTG